MKKLLIVVLVLLGVKAHAQQDALFSQYMFNRLVINPAYSGSRDVLSATIVNRYQWVGMDGAPNTLTASIHTPLRNEKIALGLYVYSDKLGPMSNSGFMANYAYRIRVWNGRLAFGLQAGIKMVDIDWNKMEMKDNDDLVILNGPKGEVMPDANFGIYYYTNRYFVGISSKHLFENTFGQVSDDEFKTYSNLTRHFYAMAGVAIPLSDRFVFRPSTLVKYAQNAPVNVDINASMLYNETFWFGASYRTSRNALVFILEFNLRKNLRIGYSYDTYMSELKNHSLGSHEIMIGYDINLFKPRMLSPRYF